MPGPIKSRKRRFKWSTFRVTPPKPVFQRPARYYDADVVHLMSPVPVGLFGGINLGSYAPNSNILIDPFGFEDVRVWHYTDKKRFNGANGSGIVKASDPAARGKGAIKGKATAVYVTTVPPKRTPKIWTSRSNGSNAG